MNRMVKALINYVVYPICFAGVGFGVIHFGIKPVMQAVDAKICMEIINGAPVAAMDYELQFPALPEPGTNADDHEQQTEQASEEKESIKTEILVKEPDYGTQYGSISCEEIKLDAPLYYGDGDDLLRRGAGQYTGSAMPGSNGVSIIGAHDSTFFGPLEKVKVGSEVVITTNYGEFTYLVSGVKISKATDESAYQLETEEEQVILYTCYPFGTLSTNRDDRYYVYCSRVE